VKPNGRIPKDTKAVVTALAGAGSGAGGGYIRVIIDWIGTGNTQP